MKLYYMPGACSLATHIVLEWIGVPYDTKKLSHDELKADAYLRINPQGMVPALELDDGTVLTQNQATLGYLADAHPAAKLEGDGTPKGRAEVHHWLGLINSDLHPAFKPLFGATAYLGDEATIDKTKQNARKMVRRLFELADKSLQKRDFIAGTRSIADAYLFVLTSWTKKVGIDLSDLAGITRFQERMQADPAVRKAMGAEGLV